jgi:hypothetical protein
VSQVKQHKRLAVDLSFQSFRPMDLPHLSWCGFNSAHRPSACLSGSRIGAAFDLHHIPVRGQIKVARNLVTLSLAMLVVGQADYS